ncbi:type II secretion system F family protein [Clostridium sp. YIM B02515]|uniref:Type II secretion system F family protein n=1 Tax=Clostridium rhizosphaerae TaxID=2803861 RepID=A0ABS1TCW8_9CLOT|nr:type II secretion system F family protein [Clostridium rhizosphaerae]MBL4937203.1 type II secretion system F family protein [Clostridium rhizosphaerae]
MPLYEYEAKTMQGTVVKGKLEAVDENTVITNLRSKNYYPMYIRPYKEAFNIELSNYKKVSVKDIAIFCRQFAFTTSSGISILRAIKIVKEQSENLKLKKILDEVFNDLQKGKDFSEALRRHKEMPDMLVNMVEVGEVSGTLDRIMERMADYYDKEYKFSKKVSQAMTYPMVVSVFAIIVVIVLVVKVLPTFTGMLSSLGVGELPLPTRIVMGISNAIRNQGLVILAALAFLVLLIRIALRNDEVIQFVDRLKLNIFIFGKLNKRIVTARFARTFGTLIASGVSLIQSIEICANVVGNRIIADALRSSRDEIKKGTSLGETLEVRNIFPMMLTQMIKIGEESGTLDSILEKTAEFYDNEVDTATAQLATLIEPLIIIVLAVVVGFIVLSIILPIFSMYSAMGS